MTHRHDEGKDPRSMYKCARKLCTLIYSSI